MTTRTHDDAIESGERRLNRQDAKTLALSALGGALEFYDFVIFVFFATVVGALFFPADMPDWLRLVQTFGIFAAGYLARPLGGIVMAHFGDLLGRKRMFMFSILLMSVPTLIMGLLPTYASIGIAAPLLLLLMRVCQGAAIGGEAPGAWVFVTEHVPSRHIGLACGTLSMGLVLGILIGSVVASLLSATFSDQQIHDWAWRLPFIFGGLLGLVTLYLRRYLHETPVFAEMQARKALAAELPVKKVVTEHRGAVVLSMLVTWVLTGAIVVTALMMPTLLQSPSIGIDRATALNANTIALVFTLIGCVVSGRMGDRFGDGPVFSLFSFGLGVSFIFFFVSVHYTTAYLVPLYALSGFFVGIVGLVPAIAVKSFPAEVRFSGLSFSYNVAYAIFGGATPLVLSLALARWSYAPAYYVAMLGVLGMLIGIYLIYSGASRASVESR